MSNRIALGRREELTHRDTLKASLAEFISTFIFVFAGQGSGAALGTSFTITEYLPIFPDKYTLLIMYACMLSLYI